MFTIRTEPFGSLTQIKLINTKTGENAGIIPGFGAVLNTLVLRKGERLLELIDGNDNFEDLTTRGVKLCKGFALFPFPNRIDNGQYIFQKKKYTLKINELERSNAIHGLVMQSAFEITGSVASEDKAELTIAYEESGKNKGYPFKVRLTVIYTLTSVGGLVSKSIIENNDEKDLPVGLGWHPYIKTGNKVDTLDIRIPSNHALVTDDRMIPTIGRQNQNPYSEKKLLTDNHFDTGYKLSENDGISVTEIFDHQQDISIKVWQKTGMNKFNYLQIYTPLDRRSIAVEPMSCAANAFNNGMGLITLAAGERTELEYGIILS